MFRTQSGDVTTPESSFYDYGYPSPPVAHGYQVDEVGQGYYSQQLQYETDFFRPAGYFFDTTRAGYSMETPPPTPAPSEETSCDSSSCGDWRPWQTFFTIDSTLESKLSSQTSPVPPVCSIPKRLHVKCRCTNCTRGQNRGPDKSHICWWANCTKEFKKTTHLKAHILLHQGVKPYQCQNSDCKKSFTRSDELLRHSRTHGPDKKFSCEHCGKGFTRSDHYKKHIWVHKSK